MDILIGDDADFMQSVEEMTVLAAGFKLTVDVYVERLFPDAFEAWKTRRDTLAALALQRHTKAAEMIAKYADEIISADMVAGVVDPKEHIRRFRELEECGIPMDDVYKLCKQHGFGWDEESDAVYDLEQAQFQPYADKYGIVYTELESSEESWREIGETLKHEGFLAFKGPEYVSLHVYRRQIPDDVALIVSKLPIPEEDLAIIATFDL
jgi:hypothetical protein